MFKCLTGKEIGHLQTGLILSQAGGLLLIFTSLFFMLPSSEITVEDGPEDFVWILLGVGIIRMLAPILVGKGSKIAFWVVIALSVLKLIESFLATIGNNLEFIWYTPVTGVIEVGVLVHLLNPKARAELK